MSKTTDVLHNLSKRALHSKNENLKFFLSVNKKKMRVLDEIVHQLHDEIFEEINCLECANCCRTLGPMISEKDIERMAKYLKIKTSVFIDQYLIIDEDRDYVFKAMPCPFLMTDDYCQIYEVRPKACREYPHTVRAKFLQISKLTVKNSEICPAVFLILEKLRNEF